MTVSASSILRLGTRGSLLARMQSGQTADELMRRHSGLRIEMIIVSTTGDKITDRPLYELGGKGLFTKELEQALLDGKIDLAVHSLKDVPVTMPLMAQENLILASIPEREDARDVLVCAKCKSLAELPAGGRIGTGSLRRRCQLLAIRPDVIVEPIRGNLDTRLRKLREGAFDALILAYAGLRRANLFDAALMSPIDLAEMLPAAGQGALALQCRRDDVRTQQIVAAVHDANTAACVTAERAVVAGLHGDCHSPIAALATIADGQLTLQTAVGAYGGETPVVRSQAAGAMTDWQKIVKQVLAELTTLGATRLLHPSTR